MEFNKIYDKVKSFKDEAYRAGAGVLAAYTLMTGVANAGNYDVERNMRYSEIAEKTHFYFEKIDEWTNKLEKKLKEATTFDEVLVIHEKYNNLERLYSRAQINQKMMEWYHREFCDRNNYCSKNKDLKVKVRKHMYKLRRYILKIEKNILKYNIVRELNKLNKELNKALNNPGDHKITTEKE